MTRRWLWLGLVLLGAFARAVTMSGQASNTLSAQEQRGKDIYFGVGAASGIKALVGSPPTDAPASLLGCVNCHGHDGTGKPEGRVVPSDITWDALTKPYGVTHRSGRTHPPYDERLLVRAICMGLDPAGHELDLAMPRFQMSREDIHALLLYLKRLAADRDAGIDESRIRIGTIVPATGPLAEAGQAVRSILTAYFAAINSHGGIFGRRLELEVATLGDGDTDAIVNLEALLRDAPPFAMVGGVIAGAEREIVKSAERHRIPFVGPLTMFPEGGHAGAEHTFYLLSGVEQQARALIEHSGQSVKSAGGSMAILYSERVTPPSMVDALQESATRAGWSDVRAFNRDRDGPTVQALVDEWHRSQVTHVLLLAGGRELHALAEASASVGWTPTLLMPGSMATNDLLTLPAASADRLFLALPSLPSDQTQAGLSEYRALADTSHVSDDQMALQIAALCSAKVLIQALKLAGRAVSREKVVAALEGLYDFDTGLMPRIGFSPNRRVGAPGAYIVTVDANAKRFTQLTGWLSVE